MKAVPESPGLHIAFVPTRDIQVNTDAGMTSVVAKKTESAFVKDLKKRTRFDQQMPEVHKDPNERRVHDLAHLSNGL